MNAMHSLDWVEGWRDRRRASKDPGVIVSPAGMLKGGPAAFYISKVGKKASNAVFLVSYQIPGTPGKELWTRVSAPSTGKFAKLKRSTATLTSPRTAAPANSKKPYAAGR